MFKCEHKVVRKFTLEIEKSMHGFVMQVEPIKGDASLGLDCELGLWRLHTMLDQRLQLLYFIGQFQPISTKFGHSNPMAS